MHHFSIRWQQGLICLILFLFLTSVCIGCSSGNAVPPPSGIDFSTPTHPPITPTATQGKKGVIVLLPPGLLKPTPSPTPRPTLAAVKPTPTRTAATPTSCPGVN